MNSLSLTDSYKASHFLLYPPNTTEISGYFEARASSKFDHISFFGLQYYIKNKLLPFIENMDIEEAERTWNKHGLPFNRKGFEALKELGYLPIEIQAVPEGMYIPKDNVLLQMKNTHPDFAWLVTWLETSLVQLWYPCTVASLSKKCKIMMKKYLEETGCENIESVLLFMLHDFGCRGASSMESASIGGAAHLTNFMGTDTFIALDLLREYYNMDMAGYSIPAMEHSTVIAWENEDDSYQNILDMYLKENAILACVSDSTDFKRVNSNWGTRFKQQIETSGGRVVVRHDSGSPLYNSIDAIRTLMDNFGSTINTKGYKVLPNYIRFIWGDGADYAIIDQTLHALIGFDIASENIVFGMGGALLQRVDRDTCSFAFKINEVVQNNTRRAVYKHPVTGKGKASKPGRQALIFENGQYRTIPEIELHGRENILRTVFKDGNLLIDETFETIRKRADV